MQASWLLFPTSLTSCPINLKAPLKLWSSCPVYAHRWGAQAESMGSPTTPRQPSGLCLTPDPNSLSSWQMPQVHLAQALWKAPQDKNLTHVGAHQALSGLGPSLFPGSPLRSGLQLGNWRHLCCGWALLPPAPFPAAHSSSPGSLLPRNSFNAPPLGCHITCNQLKSGCWNSDCIPISLVNCLSLYSQHCRIHDSCLRNVWGTIIFIYWSKLFT